MSGSGCELKRLSMMMLRTVLTAMLTAEVENASAEEPTYAEARTGLTMDGKQAE